MMTEECHVVEHKQIWFLLFLGEKKRISYFYGRTRLAEQSYRKYSFFSGLMHAVTIFLRFSNSLSFSQGVIKQLYFDFLSGIHWIIFHRSHWHDLLKSRSYNSLVRPSKRRLSSQLQTAPIFHNLFRKSWHFYSKLVRHEFSEKGLVVDSFRKL